MLKPEDTFGDAEESRSSGRIQMQKIANNKTTLSCNQSECQENCQGNCEGICQFKGSRAFV